MQIVNGPLTLGCANDLSLRVHVERSGGFEVFGELNNFVGDRQFLVHYCVFSLPAFGVGIVELNHSQSILVELRVVVEAFELMKWFIYSALDAVQRVDYEY